MRILYSTWIFILFCGTFMCLLPFYVIFLQKEKWHPIALKLTHIWAVIVVRLSFIRVEKIFEVPINFKNTYVFCPNHFSFFDIPIMALCTLGKFKFIGKKSLGEIPVFGYMYRNLYITVDRASVTDAYRVVQKGVATLKKGISLVVFPEGGIRGSAPELSSFKDGAFRMAISEQIPIVPVSIPYNWIFLPDEQWIVQPHRLKVIYHEPIPTVGITEKDLVSLKKRVFEVINNSLKKELANDH